MLNMMLIHLRLIFGGMLIVLTADLSFRGQAIPADTLVIH